MKKLVKAGLLDEEMPEALLAPALRLMNGKNHDIDDAMIKEPNSSFGPLMMS